MAAEAAGRGAAVEAGAGSIDLAAAGIGAAAAPEGIESEELAGDSPGIAVRMHPEERRSHILRLISDARKGERIGITRHGS